MIPALMLVTVLQAGPAEPIATAPPAPPASAAPAAAPPPSAPPPPSSAAAAPPSAAAPPPARKIDDLSRPLTGAVPQGSYEAGVRGAFTRTQSLQGPLDGTWMLKDAAGTALYRVQLVDGGFGGPLEGAWSDLKAGAMAAGGFFTDVARDGARLILQFQPPGPGAATATLERRPDGAYAGELKVGAAAGAAVTLARP